MKKSVIIRISGVLVLQVIWWLMLPEALKNRIEWPIQDFLTRQVVSPVNFSDPRIAIIDIDETSLSTEGRWPWPRDTIAQLIDQLQHHYQVMLIGSDIIFPDNSENQDLLSHSIVHAPITTTLLWHHDADIRKGKWNGKAYCLDCQTLNIAKGWITNTPELSAQEQAHITPQIDQDGSVRRIKPLVCHADQCIEMLALSLFRQVLGLTPVYQLSTHHLTDSTGVIKLPILKDSSYLINWQNPAGKIPYISAADILHQRIHENALQGKVVIIGSSSSGLHDLVPTPLAPRFPAVEIHALLLQSLFDQHHRQVHHLSSLVSALVALGLSLIMLFNRRYALIKILPLVFIGVAGWTVWVIYQQLNGFVWPLTNVIISTGLTLAWLLPISLRQETQLKEYIHQQFSTYVPPAVVEQLMEAPEKAIGITPERRVVTIMFADLRHFSRFSETQSPEQLAHALRTIMDQLTSIVHQHQGTVDKYIGDAIMAFWGAPLSVEDHAQKSIEAAIAMYHCIDQFLYNGKKLPCTLSIGINTGEVVVGDLGSSVRRSYSVCGTAVNIAAHLEEMTRQIPHPILVGEKTFKLLNNNQNQSFHWKPALDLQLNAHTDTLKVYPLDPFGT